LITFVSKDCPTIYAEYREEAAKFGLDLFQGD